MKATSEVLSAPVGSGGGPGLASSTKRVTAPGVSAMSSASGGQPVAGAGDRRGDRGVVLPRGDRDRRPRRRRREHDLGPRQLLAQPAPGLRLGVRVGGHRLDRRRGGTRPDQQREGHRQQHLPGDHQRLAGGQLVQGGRDRALHRVLQRDHRRVGVAGPDRLDRRVHGRLRQRGPPGRRRDRAERRLGERPLGTEVREAGGRDAGHVRDPSGRGRPPARRRPRSTTRSGQLAGAAGRRGRRPGGALEAGGDAQSQRDRPRW